jgi:hypothetical protein
VPATGAFFVDAPQISHSDCFKRLITGEPGA